MRTLFRPAAVALLAFGIGAGHSTPLGAQTDERVWQFFEGRDEQSRRMTARLVYGIPETDAVTVSGVCEARSGTAIRSSNVTFGADVASLRNGKRVTLQFSGGGASVNVKGTVTGVGNTQERVAGVRVDLSHNDPLWRVLRTKTAVDYFVPGYRSTTLLLADGKLAISDFVETCKGYANALQQTTSNTSGGNSDGGITEKEAFAIAKDLGTIDGWEAFLNNYSTGFRADLARAYVRKLGAGSATASSGGSGTGQTTQTTQANPEPVGETRYIDAGSDPWWNAKRRVAYDGGRGKYTANVRAGGLEMVAYCHRYGGNRDLTLFLREVDPRPGSRLGRKLRQAATGAPHVSIPGGWDNTGQIEVEFSDGSRVRGAATNRNYLEKQFSVLSRGRAIKATDPLVSSLMSANTVRIGAPPIDVTFQLSGSRAAICSVLNRCGERRSACRGVRSTSSGDSGGGYVAPKPKAKSKTCSGGRFYSRSRKACRCPASKSSWNGSFCERPQRSCGKNYKLVKGQCILKQNCGRNAYRSPEGDCYCNKGYDWKNGKCKRIRKIKKISCSGNRVFSRNRNKCVCPKSEPHWYGGRCRAQRDCPGDSELIKGQCRKVNYDNGQDAPQKCGKGRGWVGAQGRCVCLDSSRRWNGKRCVKKKSNNQQNVKKTACGILQTACALGSNSSCRKFQKNCQ